MAENREVCEVNFLVAHPGSACLPLRCSGLKKVIKLHASTTPHTYRQAHTQTHTKQMETHTQKRHQAAQHHMRAHTGSELSVTVLQEKIAAASALWWGPFPVYSCCSGYRINTGAQGSRVLQSKVRITRLELRLNFFEGNKISSDTLHLAGRAGEKVKASLHFGKKCR